MEEGNSPTGIDAFVMNEAVMTIITTINIIVIVTTTIIIFTTTTTIIIVTTTINIIVTTTIIIVTTTIVIVTTAITTDFASFPPTPVYLHQHQKLTTFFPVSESLRL